MTNPHVDTDAGAGSLRWVMHDVDRSSLRGSMLRDLVDASSDPYSDAALRVPIDWRGTVRLCARVDIRDQAEAAHCAVVCRDTTGCCLYWQWSGDLYEVDMAVPATACDDDIREAARDALERLLNDWEDLSSEGVVNVVEFDLPNALPDRWVVETGDREAITDYIRAASEDEARRIAEDQMTEPRMIYAYVYHEQWSHAHGYQSKRILRIVNRSSVGIVRHND